jgi:hypothetical protein
MAHRFLAPYKIWKERKSGTPKAPERLGHANGAMQTIYVINAMVCSMSSLQIPMLPNHVYFVYMV